jgi:L-ascorbate metabolism protein UlaG (beta-lactamase superfamily)
MLYRSFRVGGVERRFLWLWALAAALVSAAGCGAQSVEVLAIANEGFLVRSGQRAVVVDALFRATAPYPEFFSQGPSDELVGRMIDGEGLFADIDLALVTHSDGDHFHAETALAFLESHPETMLVGTVDVVEKLAAEKGFETYADRVVVPVRSHGSCEILEHREVANNIYVVDLDGFTFLHEGDADRSPATFAGLDLGDSALDLAFLHDWFVLNDGREVLTGILDPGAVVLMHHRWERAVETRRRIEDLPVDIATTLPPVTVLGAELESATFVR